MPASRAPDRAGIRFEYVGAGALTVVGPVTGKAYRFVGYGARLEVDVRDRLSIRGVPHLREIRGS